MKFQLTPSRRATHSDLHSLDFLIYFNSRPHGGRRIRFGLRCILAIISTHALTEGDNQILHGSVSDETFQLTPSRRATAGKIYRCSSCQISTHALTEGDNVSNISFVVVTFFQLTPSRRATRYRIGLPQRDVIFQLTPSRRATDHIEGKRKVYRFQLTPSRRATKVNRKRYGGEFISTHALTEGDACDA